MGYSIENENLRARVERHGSVELTAIRQELQLLRGLIEGALAEHDSPSEALAHVHGPIQSVFKIASVLRDLELRTGDLITKAAMLELAYGIGGQISKLIGEEVDTETRNRIVDRIKPALVEVVAQYMPKDAVDQD